MMIPLHGNSRSLASVLLPGDLATVSMPLPERPGTRYRITLRLLPVTSITRLDSVALAAYLDEVAFLGGDPEVARDSGYFEIDLHPVLTQSRPFRYDTGGRVTDLARDV